MSQSLEHTLPLKPVAEIKRSSTDLLPQIAALLGTEDELSLLCSYT